MDTSRLGQGYMIAGIGACTGLFATIAIAYEGFEASRSPLRAARTRPLPSPGSTAPSGPATPPTF
jgi:hypothetical protein